MKRKLMWFDAEANMQELSSLDGLKRNISKCSEIGIDTIIVDVKPLSGFVLYESKIAPKIKNYPLGYDLLSNAVEIGHEFGIKVYAAINVFSEGSHIEPGGKAFEHENWQCVELTADGLKRTGELENEHDAVFVTPHKKEVTEYELSIIKEICSNYNIDGITLDRMRYPNLFADFSNYARSAFEESFGIVENWPNDVMVRTQTEYKLGSRFSDWLIFRAQTINNFFENARQTAKEAKADIDFGVYTGSWYQYYFDVGVNWGCKTIKPKYQWWPEGYEQTGYIEFADYICTGCYYPNVTRKEAIMAGLQPILSVEDGIAQSNYAVNGESNVFASIYVRDYKDNPEGLQNAVNLCLEKTDGCMLFDLVQVRDYDYWNLLKTD